MNYYGLNRDPSLVFYAPLQGDMYDYATGYAAAAGYRLGVPNTTFLPQKNGNINGYKFDNTNYIDYGNKPGATFTALPTLLWSITAWCYTTGSGGYQFLLSKATSGSIGYALGIDSSGNWFVQVAAKYQNFSVCNYAQIQHVALTMPFLSGQYRPNFYINGIMQPYGTGSTPMNSMSSSYNLRIGGNQWTTAAYWLGGIWDVRIYRRALTSDEITKIYKATIPTFPTKRIYFSGGSIKYLNLSDTITTSDNLTNTLRVKLLRTAFSLSNFCEDRKSVV